MRRLRVDVYFGLFVFDINFGIHINVNFGNRDVDMNVRDFDLGRLDIDFHFGVIAVGICFLVTMSYSVAAGMWAVLWTDLVQFVIKMSAVIILAVYAVKAVGGIAALRTGLEELGSTLVGGKARGNA